MTAILTTFALGARRHVRSTRRQRAVSAQENFDKLMLRVNQWIMDGMKKGAASPIITLG